MLTQKDLEEIAEVTMKDYPLLCGRKYEDGPFPECETCDKLRKMFCPFTYMLA